MSLRGRLSCLLMPGVVTRLRWAERRAIREGYREAFENMLGSTNFGEGVKLPRQRTNWPHLPRVLVER